MIFCARATRGLRRMGEERPGALLARRTRTMKRCSSDARSRGQPRPLPLKRCIAIGMVAHREPHRYPSLRRDNDRPSRSQRWWLI